MKKNLKAILSLGAVLGIIALVAVPVLRPKAVRVETARAVRGSLQVTVDGEGRTRSRERFVVAAPVTGLLKRISLRSGDAVHAGATLAIIEPAPVSALPMTSQDLAYVRQSAIVRSPANGRVLRVLEESERVVTTGTPLLELSNTSQLEVVVDLLSTDAVKIVPGASVVIEGWGGDKPLEARVRVIEPSAFTKVSALGIEEQRVNVIADFIDLVGLIGDGFRVDARIVTWQGEDVLKVPASALFRHGQDWSLFVVDGGKARRVEVETGHRTSSEVEIKMGIREGEIVILHPSNDVADGVRVDSDGIGEAWRSAAQLNCFPLST